MGYPFVLAYEGDQFARVNYDGSWSILWDKADIVANTPLTEYNKAIVGCAKICAAARERIHSMPWEDSNAWESKWVYDTKTVDVVSPDSPISPNVPFLLHFYDGVSRGQINFNGTWTCHWNLIEEVSGNAMDNWRTIAVIAFCRLLMVAKANLETSETEPVPPEEPDVIEEGDAIIQEPLVLGMWDRFSAFVRGVLGSFVSLWE